jgi:hypothetical protein
MSQQKQIMEYEMSNILRNVPCESCGKVTFDYISFGHNKYCVEWNWTCKHCGHKNHEHNHPYFWFGRCCYPGENGGPDRYVDSPEVMEGRE